MPGGKAETRLKGKASLFCCNGNTSELDIVLGRDVLLTLEKSTKM